MGGGGGVVPKILKPVTKLPGIGDLIKPSQPTGQIENVTSAANLVNDPVLATEVAGKKKKRLIAGEDLRSGLAATMKTQMNPGTTLGAGATATPTAFKKTLGS